MPSATDIVPLNAPVHLLREEAGGPIFLADDWVDAWLNHAAGHYLWGRWERGVEYAAQGRVEQAALDVAKCRVSASVRGVKRYSTDLTFERLTSLEAEDLEGAIETTRLYSPDASLFDALDFALQSVDFPTLWMPARGSCTCPDADRTACKHQVALLACVAITARVAPAIATLVRGYRLRGPAASDEDEEEAPPSARRSTQSRGALTSGKLKEAAVQFWHPPGGPAAVPPLDVEALAAGGSSVKQRGPIPAGPDGELVQRRLNKMMRLIREHALHLRGGQVPAMTARSLPEQDRYDDA